MVIQTVVVVVDIVVVDMMVVVVDMATVVVDDVMENENWQQVQMLTMQLDRVTQNEWAAGSQMQEFAL